MSKLIKKYQYGGLNSWGKTNYEDPTKFNIKFFNKNLANGMKDYSTDFSTKQQGFNQVMNTKSWANGIVPSSLMSLSNGTTPSSGGVVPDIGNTGIFGKIGKDFKAGGVSKDLLTIAPQITEFGIQSLGGKEADNISGGEQLFSTGTDIAFKTAMKTGNPLAIGITGALKGLDLVNKYAGPTAKKQGTIGLDTGGYNFALNAQAGKKNTVFSMFGKKTTKINNLTKRYDRQNLLAGNANYKDQANQLTAQNTFGDIATKNQQQLYGGLNFNALSAKKGGKILPAYLRTIVKKAKKKVSDKTSEVISPKFQEGGQLNVIPEGALHARKHDLPENVAEQVTGKGIPVVTYDEGGDITQHAEIERDEIIFNKETTLKLEDLFKKYNETESEEEKNKLAIEAGKFLTFEILENTDDRTNLISQVE